MKDILLYCVLGLILMGTACNKDPLIDTQAGSTKDLHIPASFDFKATAEIGLDVIVKSASTILTGVPINIYLDNPGYSEAPNPDAKILGTYSSDDAGRIRQPLRLPSYQDTVYLQTGYFGLESLVAVPVIGGSVVYTYGQGGNSLPGLASGNSPSDHLKSGVTYTYLGTYTNQGVPNYLLTPRDVIPQSLLTDLSSLLPEYKNLTVTHPEFLAKTNEASAVITQEADVWVTFIHEGAGWMNALGYYVFDTNNPPRSIAEIAKRNIIFPNVSFSGSGGGLTSGDKVFLGRFPAGKTIGWFVVTQGWNGNTVSGTARIVYSEPSFNAEVDPLKKQHNVLLYDSKRSVMILGFEDMNRESGADNDFNDVIFYVTSNPVTAIDVSNVPHYGTAPDRDYDGVSDALDSYPDDKNLAYDSYYPSKGAFGSLLTEDLWPALGDFDFNDLVVDYNFQIASDARNNIKQLTIQLKTRAIGASYHNGLGIRLPIASNLIESVTGYNVKGKYIKLSSKGIEESQSDAVIIAFEDAYDELPHNGNGTGVNVIAANGWTEPKILTLKVVLTTAQTPAAMGQAPYDPFLIEDGVRGKEIHLSGNKPTDLADPSFFGQYQDITDPKTGVFYKSDKNLSWMLSIPASFDYMTEKSDIIKGYLKFGAWAESGGVLFPDWYLNKTGYRDQNLIYKH